MLLDLTDQEVQNLINILTQSTGMPWVMTHPLIMKIGQQQQQQLAQPQQAQPQAMMTRGNSHDDSDLDQERGAAGSVRPAGRDTTATEPPPVPEPYRTPEPVEEPVNEPPKQPPHREAQPRSHHRRPSSG